MSQPAFAVVREPLDLAALTAAIAGDAGGTPGGIGAVSSFVGLVRRNNAGRTVHYLEYEAYEPLALKAFERIAAEIAEDWPAARIGLHHRVGRLELGEASIAIVAVSPHRGEAFAACRYAIERVKQIAPIWKHEYFDGGEVWVEGATADPDSPEARATARQRACA